MFQLYTSQISIEIKQDKLKYQPNVRIFTAKIFYYAKDVAARMHKIKHDTCISIHLKVTKSNITANDLQNPTYSNFLVKC